MAYYKNRVCLIVFLLTFSFSAVSNQNSEDIRALLIKNPTEALVQAKNLWSGKEVNKNNVMIGFLLIETYVSNQDMALAKDLIEQFLALPEISVEEKGLFLAMRLKIARMLKEDEVLLKTSQDAESLIKELSLKVSAKSQKLTLYYLYLELGFKFYFSADYEKAEPLFLKALKNIDKKQIHQYSNLLNTLGVVQAQQAKLLESAQYMLDSIEILESSGLPVGPDRYLNLGGLYYGLKDFEKTIEYSNKGLSKQTENNQHSISLYSNMAAAQIELKRNDEAVKNLHQAIKIAEQLGLSSASARNNLGYLYKEMGELENALEQLNLSAEELGKDENSDLTGVSFKSRADVYAEMKNYDQALSLYEQAYEVFKQRDLKLKRVELYPQMLGVLEIKKDYRRAYEILVEYKALNDELTAVDSSNQVNEMLSKFELKNKEKELLTSELVRDKQQKDIEILNNQNTFEHKVRNLMLALLGVLIVVLISIYRSWRYRGQVNKELSSKSSRIEKQHVQLMELNGQLKVQAEIDTLTGLKNRRYITQMVADASLMDVNEQKQWCLIIIDLDDFKKVNDTYGHQRGDQVLKQFALCLVEVKKKQ